MARYGKIARLPHPIRIQLNARLQDGREGAEILAWLNALPEVKQTLAAAFQNRPITKQNLSDWRLGGYEDQLARQDILAQVKHLAACHPAPASSSPGAAIADHLAAVVNANYAAILASESPKLDAKALRRLRDLRSFGQLAVNLRRASHAASRSHLKSQRAQTSQARKLAQSKQIKPSRA